MHYESYKKYIDDTFIKYQNNVCFSYLDKENIINHFTVKDINDRTVLYKTLIKKMNIKAGEKVCLISNNLVYSQITFVCSTYANICIVLIDPNLPLSQIHDMISSIDIKLILTDKHTYQKIHSIVDCKALDIENNYKSLNNMKIKESKTNNLDEMAIIFSSGTTSITKPIVVTYDSIINSILKASELIQNHKIQDCLCLLPVYHISGILSLLSCFYQHKCIQTLEEFKLNNLVNIFTVFKPNAFIMPPIVIEKMIDELEHQIINKSMFLFHIYNACCNISLLFKKSFNIKISLFTKAFYRNIFANQLKLLICSSSKLPQKIVNKINGYGIDLVNVYASTECAGPITWTLNSQVFDESVGKVDSNPNVSIKLINIDENGNGEICIKTNSLMKCYYNDLDLTNASFTEDGYFKSGDLGKIVNNYLYITGRVKEVIKLRNGKKLSSSNLETLLEGGCPKNNKVIICGYSKNNDEYDDIYAFFKDLNYSDEDKKNIKRTLLDYNNGILKSYPIKYIYFIKKIPTNSVGKVEKYKLTNLINSDDNKLENKSSIINILSKYINIDNDFNVNKPLNDLGIDSLSMYSIIVDIKEKYNVDILPFLTSNTNTQDLINSLNSYDYDDIKLRKIDTKEIKELAKLAAESFYNYPLYEVIYPDLETRYDLLLINCWFIIYQRQYYSYVNDDKTLYIAFKKSGDKQRPIIGLLVNFDFIKHVFKTHNIFYCLKVLRTYNELADKYKKMYYNPDTDNYIQNMFIRKDHQGNGLIFKALRYLDDGKNIFAETHSEQNLQLFKKMGINVIDVGKWQNIKHYVLKREKIKK